MMELCSRQCNSALLLAALCTLFFSTVPVLPTESFGDPRATCIIQPLGLPGNNSISGVIKLWQLSAAESVHVVGNLSGFASDGKHGFHVHVYGDLSNNCLAAGPHYNPFNKSHGAPNDTERHVGDLGNIIVVNGWSVINITDNIISLVGGNSIVNRSLVVHAWEDDLGYGNTTKSKETGNSGDRIGCCVITLDPDITITTTTSGPTQPGPSATASPIEPFATVLFFCLILAKVL